MSKYTTELRYVCEQFSGLSPDVYPANEVIAAAIPHIFNFTFPIADEDHREELEAKILKHYYFREIGFETAEQWRFYLDTRLNEIMPYYNEMYRSAMMLMYDPLNDVDYSRITDGTTESTFTGRTTRDEDTTSTQDVTDTQTGTQTNAGQSLVTDNNTQWNKFQDTPQGALTNIENNTYLSEARQITDSGTQNGSSSNTRTDNLTFVKDADGTFNVDETINKDDKENGEHHTLEHVKGLLYGGSKAKRVMEFRKAVMNIDMEIISNLYDLFMLVY